jgi:hypothetical protein
LLVVQAVGSALDDPDLVVEALDEAEGDFVFRLAIGGVDGDSKPRLSGDRRGLTAG